MDGPTEESRLDPSLCHEGRGPRRKRDARGVPSRSAAPADAKALALVTSVSSPAAAPERSVDLAAEVKVLVRPDSQIGDVN